MTRNQSLLFKCLLFLAGAGIIVLAFFLFKGERELNGKDAFVWTSIGLMYLALSLPFFFSGISIKNFSGKIPSLTMVWLGIFLYIGSSIGVILLLVTAKIITINVAIIIQAVLVFLFAIDVYIAYFASSHVQKVATQEAGKQQYINQLKSKAQVLLLSVDKLPAEYEKARKILKQAIEEIRYISPVDSGAGDELELRIIQSLNIISEICGGVTTGAGTVSLDSEAERLNMLVKERKLLRN
jgi:low affinity Fe/Cu permease